MCEIFVTRCDKSSKGSYTNGFECTEVVIFLVQKHVIFVTGELLSIRIDKLTEF